MAERQELISARVRKLLADCLAESYVLRDIEEEFGAAQIVYKADPSFTGGQRRTMVAGYYNGLEWTNPTDICKFLDALSAFLREADRRQKVIGSVKNLGRPACAWRADRRGWCLT